MKFNTVFRGLLAASALLAFAASAQTLKSLTLEPAQAKVGEPVKATLTIESSGAYNCGARIQWGDGAMEEFRIQSEKDSPKVLTHVYAKAGNYKAEVDPKRVSSSLKCGGDKPNAMVAVVAPAPVAAPAAPAASTAKPPIAAAPSACPAGWKMSKAGTNKKTKAFTCIAAANTKVPDPKMACPGELTYFENVKKGQLGCRP